MEQLELINQAYKKATSYPELVRELLKISILSYTVDVASGITLFRFPEGQIVWHEKKLPLRTISKVFNLELTISAIRNNQQHKSTYAEFLEDIAAAGIFFYEATLTGNNKRVTYIGVDGHYSEDIPL